MIRWVFLDVGNVVLDEDVLTYGVFRLHVEAIRGARPDRSFLDLLEEREALALRGSRWPVFEVASRYLPPGRVAALWEESRDRVLSDFASYHPLITGAREAIEILAGRYRLGIIANQPPEARRLLEDLGLLSKFQVVCLSEEMGQFKPDPALFSSALMLAGATPAECLMVGDRYEQDVVPARRLGMAAVLVRRGLRPGSGRPDLHPDLLAYSESLARIEEGRADVQGSEGVTTVGSLGELAAKLTCPSPNGASPSQGFRE